MYFILQAAKLELDKFFSNTYFETANKNNVENGEVFLTAKSDMIDEITDGFGKFSYIHFFSDNVYVNEWKFRGLNSKIITSCKQHFISTQLA